MNQIVMAMIAATTTATMSRSREIYTELGATARLARLADPTGVAA